MRQVRGHLVVVSTLFRGLCTCWLMWMGLIGDHHHDCQAQEIRVHTRVLELSSDHERPRILAHSLTIFHGGKVYDYLNSLNEVTIYEPALKRFTILHIASGSAARIEQDEVRRYLSLVEEQLRARVQDWASDVSRSQDLKWIAWQLDPTFEVSVDEARRLVSCIHPFCRYEIETTTCPVPEVVDVYLKSADRLAEINALLHPHALLPSARQRVNAILLQHGWLPISVRRTLSIGGQQQDLRVDHEWKWRLEEVDRRFISQWEAQLQKAELRWLPFPQQQREVLTNRISQR
ncbi:MAG: hypothetical protein KatS3mg113_0778 [Planctomycetaceae bacterium]|nr:MAG: hypothetical protein KatS3mg113_0778 [Planctomycetaceae bacterium]